MDAASAKMKERLEILDDVKRTYNIDADLYDDIKYETKKD